MDTFFKDLQADAVLITNTIHKQAFLRSSDETFKRTGTVFSMFVAVATIHAIFLKIVRGNKAKLQLKNSKEVHKAAYQFTNMLVNFYLGLHGFKMIYHSEDPLALILPKYEPDFLSRIVGYEHLIQFFSFQLGYNLWALPVGIFKVDENPFMILHHISVLTSTSMACYSNIGYAIYSAYIFGMAELSSVPLAIMNLFKDRKEYTKKNFAVTFAIVKVWFAVSFLVLRVIVPTPMILDLMRSSFLVFSTMTFWKQTEFIDGTESFGPLKITYCGFDFLMKLSLGFLQYYWATLVVSGLAKMIPTGGAKKQKTQ